MLLTLRATHHPEAGFAASDLSFLLHKHPGKLHTIDLSFGKAYVFYPEQSETRTSACLLLEVDTLDLRGSRNKSDDHPLAHYVNDRAYAASSFLSVAIAKVFGTALGGRSKERQALADAKLPFEAEITALPSRGGVEEGRACIQRLFEPLGYETTIATSDLDDTFPAWGESPYFNIRLRATTRLQDLLKHLYVLIPVLDHDKHYWVGPDEVEKLLRHGEPWLQQHPEREFITSRYLKSIRSLANSALSRLQATDDCALEDAPIPTIDPSEEDLERPERLNDIRLQTVKDALMEGAPKRVIDLGCGEGKLLRLLMNEHSLDQLVGLDVSHRSLDQAQEQLNNLPEGQRARISLLHGSLTYRDSRLSGFDAAALIEVIEHLDPFRLEALERVVFQFARPKRVIVTTPNREFNSRFTGLSPGKLRHRDHRFEWTRAEFEDWARRIASTFLYQVEFRPIGPLDSELGAPTQMGVFTL